MNAIQEPSEPMGGDGAAPKIGNLHVLSLTNVEAYL